ncbi:MULTISPECIES: hypothetical protein [unclassified Streptomyces]|uniref:hypothetical protein n=1 Tax=unclassified Streptomyces TaxID=2593676 RepID=UPI001F33C7F5|nr:MULTISPECIES: hypothetical protein [unclassified Streptomyces]
MSRNTAWDTRRPWGNWRPPKVPDGPPPVWSERLVVAGAAALYVGLMLAFEVYSFAEVTFESWAPPEGIGGGLLALPFSLCCGVPVALWVNLAVVLPVVWAARRVSGRLHGRDAWWWVPAIAVVPAGLVTIAVTVTLHPGPDALALTWTAGEALIAGPALLAREAGLHGRRLHPRIFGYGAVAVAVVFGIGMTAFRIGLLTEYRPPRVNAAALAGTWTDGHGGTLRLNADGSARAEGLTDHESAYADNADADRAKYRCMGPGTWVYAPGEATTWDQRLNVRIERCGFDDFNEYVDSGWLISGTPEHPKLVRLYGDLDAPGVYTLTR